MLAQSLCARLRRVDRPTAIEVEDCDPDTFARFVDFLYTGQYAAAAPRPRSMPCKSSLDSLFDGSGTPEEATLDYGQDDESEFGTKGEHVEPTVEQAKRSEKSKEQSSRASNPFGWSRQKPALSLRQQTLERFKNFTLPAPPTVIRPPTYGIMPNPDPYEDHSDVLLSHAKLHAFAVRYDITDLQHLSINRLHEALVNFTVHPECTDDIARLLRYSYLEIPGDNDYELEALVVAYAACHVETLVENAIFRSTVGNWSDFAVDLLDNLMCRLDT